MAAVYAWICWSCLKTSEAIFSNKSEIRSKEQPGDPFSNCESKWLTSLLLSLTFSGQQCASNRWFPRFFLVLQPSFNLLNCEISAYNLLIGSFQTIQSETSECFRKQMSWWKLGSWEWSWKLGYLLQKLTCPTNGRGKSSSIFYLFSRGICWSKWMAFLGKKAKTSKSEKTQQFFYPPGN